MTRADLPQKLQDRIGLTLQELAQISGLSVSCLRGEIARGRLGARRVGGGSERSTWLIPIDAALAWATAESGA